MRINFLNITTNKKRFGLCDDTPPPHKPAYLDETNGEKWIAVVENNHNLNITFVPIDNWLELRNDDDTMAKRCDALLVYKNTVIFIELKQRTDKKGQWVQEGYDQLKSVIAHFEKTDAAQKVSVKKAYIANSKRPYAEKGRKGKMEQFALETGYALRITNRIEIE